MEVQIKVCMHCLHPFLILFNICSNTHYSETFIKFFLQSTLNWQYLEKSFYTADNSQYQFHNVVLVWLYHLYIFFKAFPVFDPEVWLLESRLQDCRVWEVELTYLGISIIIWWGYISCNISWKHASQPCRYVFGYLKISVCCCRQE